MIGLCNLLESELQKQGVSLQRIRGDEAAPRPGEGNLFRISQKRACFFVIQKLQLVQRPGAFNVQNPAVCFGTVFLCCNFRDNHQIKFQAFCPEKIKTAAIICKTAEAAENLYLTFDKEHRERCRRLLTEEDDFREGILLTSSYLAKGLEFDLVIVPEVTAEEYCSETDMAVAGCSQPAGQALYGILFELCADIPWPA